jgi:hypothetical protein
MQYSVEVKIVVINMFCNDSTLLKAST